MEELIDILNEKGEKTGKVATRKEVHEKGLWHEAIVVAIINEKNEILLQQRSYNKEKNAGMWDISVAGHVSANQSPVFAAIREIKEEINIDIKETELNYINRYKEKKEYTENFIENQFYDFYILKKNNLKIEDIKIQKSELEQVKFVTINELKDLIVNKKIVLRDIMYEELLKYMQN